MQVDTLVPITIVIHRNVVTVDRVDVSTMMAHVTVITHLWGVRQGLVIIVYLVYHVKQMILQQNTIHVKTSGGCDGGARYYKV